MTEEILYCSNGCTRTSNDGRIPTQTTPPSRICDRCEQRLRTWLREIPDLYATLPLFWLPGSAEPDPDKRAITRTDAPTPLRLEVTDLLDERRGRIWQGTEPTIDRRGTLGTLNVHARRLREERAMTPVDHPTVAGEAHQLAVHVGWLVQQEWISELYEDTRQVHRDLSHAIGNHAQRPVGTCPVTTDDGECGGPLLPSRFGGVHCPHCRSTWNIEDLTRLGLLIGQETA